MKKFLVISFLTVSAISLSACSSGPEEDPQIVISKAWEKLAESNAEYQMGSIDFTGSTEIEFENNSGNIDGNLKLSFDSSDNENPKTALKIDLKGDGKREGEKGSFSLLGEIRTLNKKTYLYLEDFSLDSGSAETDLTANLVQNFFKSKWFSLPGGLGLSEAEDILGKNQLSDKKISEIAKRNNFFDLKKNLGKRRYEVEINPKKLKTFIKEMNEEAQTEISESDLDQLDLILDQIRYTLILSISSDYDIERISGDISITEPENQEELSTSFDIKTKKQKSSGNITLKMSGESPITLSLEFSAKHDDDSVSIEVPKDAEELDPSSLFGFSEESLDTEDDADFGIMDEEQMLFGDQTTPEDTSGVTEETPVK